jgi:predicted Zn-dependent protease
VALLPRSVSVETGTQPDLLWLADMYEQAGRNARATRVLERAAERFPDTGDTWVALVRLLARTGQRSRAEDVLPRAQRALSASDDLWQLPLAQCYEALGRPTAAGRTFALALHAAPHNPFVQRQAVRFYLASDQPGEAAPVLTAMARSAFATPSQVAWARRMLATLPLRFRILKLPVPSSLRAAPGGAVPDRASRAWLLAGGGKMKEALAVFEETRAARESLAPEDRYLLAHLYALNGKPGRALDLLEELASHPESAAQAAAASARLLIDARDLTPARQWLNRLRALEPDSPRVRELQAILES